MLDPVVTVVGIGADGWPALGAAAQDALQDADVIAGSTRQLALLDDRVRAERIPWPTPLLSALPSIVAAQRGRRLVVLASGDPMLFGIGSNLAALVGAQSLDVIPHASSVSLACARLGWPCEDVEVVSLVGRPTQSLHPAVQHGRRVVALVSEAGGAAAVCALLVARGYGASRVVLLEQLGGAAERIVSGSAAAWTEPAHDRLAIVAIECAVNPDTVALPRTPGLPDNAFEHDGQITRREIRAMALAALAPVPGQLLWDVGAGSGSIGIEWMRCHPASRAVAIEPRADRAARIRRNADLLGVPGLELVEGTAPEALADLPAPDAIFVGGGVSVAGVLDACMRALSPGGRIVANGVTIEAEGALTYWHAQYGGTLTRIALEHVEPLGRFTTWRPALPVTQWAYRIRAA